MLRKGFTLIELLIVVAIIAILAAIAVPNFLEAQVRSKVTRCYSDMRSISVAIESYQVDNNRYPPPSMASNRYVGYYAITSPVAYIHTLPEDIFKPKTYIYGTAFRWNRIPDNYESDNLAGIIQGWANPVNPFYLKGVKWQLSSFGPDLENNPYDYPTYDPSNGSISRGLIFRVGP